MGPRELSVSVSLWGWFLPKLTFYSLFGTILYLKNCSVNFFFFSFFLFVCDYGSCGKRKRQMLLQSEPTFFHFKAVLLYFHIVPAKRCFSLSLSLSHALDTSIYAQQDSVYFSIFVGTRVQNSQIVMMTCFFLFSFGDPESWGNKTLQILLFGKDHGTFGTRFFFFFFFGFCVFLFY